MCAAKKKTGCLVPFHLWAHSWRLLDWHKMNESALMPPLPPAFPPPPPPYIYPNLCAALNVICEQSSCSISPSTKIHEKKKYLREKGMRLHVTNKIWKKSNIFCFRLVPQWCWLKLFPKWWRRRDRNNRQSFQCEVHHWHRRQQVVAYAPIYCWAGHSTVFCIDIYFGAAFDFISSSLYGCIVCHLSRGNKVRITSGKRWLNGGWNCARLCSGI